MWKRRVLRDPRHRRGTLVPGGVKFDDLPPEFRGNVNMSEVPYDPKPGDAPASNDAEIDDLVAFLRTLTNE